MAFTRLGRDDLELADKIADAFSAEREATSSLVPGAVDTLESLRKRGIRLALITNGGSEMQRAKIQKFGLAPFFDNILVEGEFGCGKPDEAVFLHSLEKLKVSPSDAWMVGDDLERDIAPCLPLGIFSIWVDWKGTGLPSSVKVEPDKIVRNIGELLPLASL
jgi:putative hydrolase of the HAD superfamily